MDPNRREFLQSSVAGSALLWLPPLMPGRLQAALNTPPAVDDRILVVVQLSGGNDGLNTLVPFGDDQYYGRRPTIAIPPRTVHRIDSHFGFHPRMTGFKQLYDRGLLSVVQGVGSPHASGDHAVAMRDWQSARPGEPSCQTGWLGRLADKVTRPDPIEVPAVFVGQTSKPFTLNSERAVVPVLNTLQQWVLRPGVDPETVTAKQRAEGTWRLVDHAQSEHELIDLVRRGTQAASATSRRVRQAMDNSSPAATSTYPEIQLAQTLRIVADLIRANLGIRVFCTELGGDGFGGFDNHANQLGNHCALLQQLSDSVAAFVRDLEHDGLLDRTVLMTFSEFGRTTAENGRRGTDHGSAAPMFLAGGQLLGGLIGTSPDLVETENGGQKFHTDFRRLYVSLLEQWLGIPSQGVLEQSFEPLTLFRA